MILSDVTLNKMIKEGTLTCEPLTPESVQPASIDCRLGSDYLLLEDTTMHIITLDEQIQYRQVEGDSIVLPPHSFCLATTLEYVKLPDDLTAFVEGRSSIGRMGLFI